jgi:hypothetical protein
MLSLIGVANPNILRWKNLMQQSLIHILQCHGFCMSEGEVGFESIVPGARRRRSAEERRKIKTRFGLTEFSAVWAYTPIVV